MYKYKQTIFNQIFSLVKKPFSGVIGQLNKSGRKFNFESLFKILLFAQTTWKESLREIETSLQANEWKLYHMGIESFARSTISYWNNKDNDNVFEKVFYKIYEMYNSVTWNSWNSLWIECVALDSSLISLSLWLFDRAKYRTAKWWVRIHIWIDIDKYLPKFCIITDWKKADNKVAKNIIEQWKLNKWEMIVFDRYYVDFELWKMIDNQSSFFVSRTKKNTDFVPVDFYEIKWKNITYDAKVELFWKTGKNKYSKELRVVRFYHEWDKREYEYITNNFELSASQIADVYKNRRQIETFFRRIKQNLKIKTYLWTSENAVKNQIRIALIYFVLLRYLTDSIKLWKKQLLKFVRIIWEKILEWIMISELYIICKSKKHCCISNIDPIPPPWSLFD